MSGPQSPNKPFKPIGKNGFGIQPLGPSPLGGDVHESFNVNKDGDIFNGHTTVRIPGGDTIRMPWDPK